MFGMHPLSAPLQQQGLSLGISSRRGIIQSTRFKVASLSLIEGKETLAWPPLRNCPDCFISQRSVLVYELAI